MKSKIVGRGDQPKECTHGGRDEGWRCYAEKLPQKVKFNKTRFPKKKKKNLTLSVCYTKNKIKTIEIY